MLQLFSIIITNAAQKKSYYFDIINSKKKLRHETHSEHCQNDIFLTPEMLNYYHSTQN